MEVSLISPINNPSLKEFSYNPDEINQFSMARIIGLGLTLIKDIKLEEESLNKFRKTFDGIKVGDIEIIYERLINNHPFYNGDIYEKLI